VICGTLFFALIAWINREKACKLPSARISTIVGIIFLPLTTQINTEKSFDMAICENQRDLRDFISPADDAD
jgi:hypothetical protein